MARVLMTEVRDTKRGTMHYTPIAGTWEKEDGWNKLGSIFDQHMQSRGYIRHADELNFWDTSLVLFAGHGTWQDGGREVYEFLKEIPPQFRPLMIAHSYGGAVLAYALARRPLVTVPGVITLGTPVRRDLDKVWEKARPAIGVHVHMYAKGFGARVRLAGQLTNLWPFPPRFSREMQSADFNIAVEGGHSGIARHAKHTHQIDLALAMFPARDDLFFSDDVDRGET